MHLLDANVLIRAHEDYYSLDRVPQFWGWLITQATAGEIAMPFEIYQEITVSKGALRDWICGEGAVLLLEESVSARLLDHVLSTGYANDLTDSELEKVGQDPFLIAYALAGVDRIVVTKEISAPSRLRANRKIPDVCASVGASCIRDFDLFRKLNFKTI